MSRLECLGKSFTGSQKKSAEVTSSHNEKHKNIGNILDKVGGKAGPDKLWSPPAYVPPCSVQVSRHKGQKSELPSGDMLSEDGCSLKESIDILPRVQEKAQQAAVSGDELKMEDLKTAQNTVSTQTGRRRHDVRPEVKHHQANEGEEGDEDEDIKVPVELKMEFLRAVIKRDLKLACKLCQMILIYEPENPEASNFLPLIKKKLLEEQKAKQSSEEDDDDDDSDDSGSDEESSHSSSGSSSSCSSSPPSDDDDDDDREEKQVHRHKRCPSENDT